MLHEIAEHFLKRREKIEAFFAEKTRDLTPPLYLSCDIRNSGRKIGVVDTNLFPAGFNNLCNSYSRATSQALRRYFQKHLPQVRRLILLVEEHTRNRFYLENVHRLLQLLGEAGLEARAAYLGQEIAESTLTIELGEGKTLQLEKLCIENGVPRLSDFNADWIVSNNDFSQAPPEALLPLLDRVSPSPRLGWHRRRKSRHFSLLQELTEEFAQVVELDPWLLHCRFAVEAALDLNEEKDIQRLAAGVGRVLEQVSDDYRRYGLEENPYVFVKNDAGTYGMGLVEVMQPEEILTMNRRTRNKLLSAKGGTKNGNRHSNFLVQEGIPTADFYSGFPIEPVIYMVGFQVVGGFFRMNAERDAFSSLNTRGMAFACLCLHKIDEPHEGDFLRCAEKQNLVSLASVMARLAALAAAQEMVEL
ncbi:MAG TPA: glutamate--cysteine ligase [Deltaproteobacteria bacterium]|nr:glutamate--cysteine ligase [Deltaproteobacteria bacterium]